MTSATEIRRTFLDFFAKNGHEVVASSPLVPQNDPTLLFTNAGMVQFKNVFTGAEKRPYDRATSSQKCVRAGGKHNDLDNVGYTARHHTFFEMLGNFSFGDYFKEQAIELAWNLVTREFGLPKDRLLVTVYHTDDDAAALWRKIAGLGDDRIIRIPTSDNFWAMGDTGPCGPCSEIFFDHGEGIPGGPPGSPDEDGDRFIEIWNLVFMQFEQLSPGNRLDLPRPSIDTGMGLERIAAILQGHHDNYDIDIFRRLITASAQASGTDTDGPYKMSHRVIADHLRAAGFLIADGVMPSNEGRGYVLRRIMRRAMRHAHKMGVPEPLMYRLVPALIETMGDHYHELRRARALITETLKLEETRFRQTLDRGMRLLEETTQTLGATERLPGDVAFKLYDTYGFPLDLTQDVLRADGRGVDTEGFNAALAEARTRARASWAGSGEAATDRVWFDVRDTAGATEFLGYGATDADGVVKAILVDGAQVDAAEAGTKVSVIVNQTPFYGESGGQMGDTGRITTPEGLDIEVTETAKKLGDLHVHIGHVVAGRIAVGEAVHLAVDVAHRDALRAHHSATHLLHAALRRRLGDHVTQKGSLVAPDRLRFDFSQPTPIGREDLKAIEADVNRLIRSNAEVGTRLMTPDEAIAQGAMALFGEKYGDEVRVVDMGAILGDDGRNMPYSVELCGGTHVSRTGDIGLFKIVAEGGVAAGIRRIEAVAGDAALAFVEIQQDRLAEASATLKVAPGDLVDRISSLLDERKKLDVELARLRREIATGGASGGGEAQIEEIGGVRFAGRVLDGVPAKELRGVADALKKQVGSGVVAIVGVHDGKAGVVVGVTDDLTGRFSAVDLVRAAAEAIGGKGGGGRPDLAQAGGPEADKAADAVKAVAAALAG
ncbi:alanine--tRNA ligase [Tistrella bauzanensis]|uniref:alanine--tRNA ligase n=1 Tax=Tistrella TaxID=171436 RepID=UPI0031F66F89